MFVRKKSFIGNKPSLGKLVTSVILVTALSACSSNDDNGMVTCEAADAAATPSVEDAPAFAFASTSAADFSAGRLERVAVSEQPELSGCTPAGLSDIRVATDGNDAYAIGRFNQDSLTRFESESLDTIFQFSVLADEAASANPQDVVFLNETKAYVSRFGTTNVWIVNPSATTESEFFLGTLDLSAYDTDGATEATELVIVDDKLFILQLRLQNFSATLPSVIAVFDVNTDTEIVTGSSNAEGLNGIVLPINNASGMFFNEATNDLIVSAQGDTFNTSISPVDRLSGGLVAVDVTDFSIETLIDDNELNTGDTSAEDFQAVFFSEAVIVSAEVGYFSTFTLDEDTFGQSFSVRSFNPTTGVFAPSALPAFEDVSVTTLAVGPNGNVWVGVGGSDAPGFERIDPSDDSLVGQRIRTELVPSEVVFLNR